MNLAPIVLEHGERYGKLTGLGKVKKYDGRKLMSGEVKSCRKCRMERGAMPKEGTAHDWERKDGRSD